MKKRSIILMITLAVIMVFVLGSYLMLRSILNNERIRVIAQDALTEIVKNPVRIGRVDLNLGFRIGIKVADVLISNSPEFGTAPLAEIKHLSLDLRLLPLLRRRIEIDGVRLAGLRLNLERDTQGHLNLPIVAPGPSRGSDWSFSLSTITITGAQVTYKDSLARMAIQAQNLEQRLRFRNNTISISGSQEIMVIRSKNPSEIRIRVENSIVYDSLKRNLEIKRLAADYGPINLLMTGSITGMEKIDLGGTIKTADLSGLLALIPESSRPQRLQGDSKTEFTISGTMKEPRFEGKTELTKTSVALKGMNRPFENINGKARFNQDGIKDIAFDGGIGKTVFSITGAVNNLSHPTLNISTRIKGSLQDFESLTKELEGVKMSGLLDVDLQIKGSIEHPQYAGGFSIDKARLEGIGLAQPMTDLNLQGRFQNNGARIEHGSGNIGRSDFSLTGTISDFKNLVIEISDRSKFIDLDELFPRTEGKAKKDSRAVPITLKGKVRINHLIGLDMEFKDIDTDFSYENGIIDLKGCRAKAFDGDVLLDFYYNANNPEPYRINTRLTSISTKKVLGRFLKFENIEGKLTGMSNFQGKGFSRKEVLSNLSASGNIEITSGVFRNFVLLTELLAWLGLKDYKEVKLNDLVGSFKIENGKTRVTDWTLTSSVGDFLTNGTIGLDGNLDLNITTTLPKNLSQSVKKYHGDWLFYFDNKGQAVIDIQASGSLQKPRFGLDQNKIKERLSGRIKDEFDKKKNDLKNKLKNLFKK